MAGFRFRLLIFQRGPSRPAVRRRVLWKAFPEAQWAMIWRHWSRLEIFRGQRERRHRQAAGACRMTAERWWRSSHTELAAYGVLCSWIRVTWIYRPQRSPILCTSGTAPFLSVCL